MEKRTSFIADGIYHVYNRGNGNDKIFRNPGNYEFFMKKYWEYMNPHWDTISWCLMPNHFHFLIRVRENFRHPDKLGLLCSQAFSNFSNSYVQSYNRQHKRKGSLFMRSFKRKCVHDTEYLKTLVCYIHNNPVKDGIVPFPESWPFSSYYDLLQSTSIQFAREPALAVFENKEDFVLQHKLQLSPGYISIPYVAA